MRPALCNLLYNRYPDLYRYVSPLSISCDDGWFSIVDALSETLMFLDPECRALEVNEIRGILNYRCIEHSSEINEAIGAAVNFSHLVCKVTGKRGDVMCRNDGLYKSISLDGSLSGDSIEVFLADRKSPPKWTSRMHEHCGGSLAIAPERKIWSKRKARNMLEELDGFALAKGCAIDVPAAGFDLVHAVIRSLVPRYPGGGFSERKYALQIFRIMWGPEGISVDITPESLASITRADFAGCSLFEDVCQLENSLEYEICNLYSGLNAIRLFARNMQKRIDLKTGHIGPVDDRGQLIAVVDSRGDNALGGKQ